MAKLVKLENGNLRYSVKCLRCKSAWMEECGSNESDKVGMNHRCEKLAATIDWHGGEEKFLATFFTGKNGVLFPTWLKRNPLFHSFKAEGGHKCDARCTSAKGNSCNCECGGKNHGSQAVA